MHRLPSKCYLVAALGLASVVATSCRGRTSDVESKRSAQALGVPSFGGERSAPPIRTVSAGLGSEAAAYNDRFALVDNGPRVTVFDEAHSIPYPAGSRGFGYSAFTSPYQHVTIATTSRGWLVAWSGDSGIHTVALDSDGQPAPRVMALADPAAVLVRLACQAQEKVCLVAYSTQSDSSSTFAFRVSEQGVPLDPSPIAIPGAPFGGGGLRASAVQGGFLVMTLGNAGLSYGRVGTDGQLLDSQGVPGANTHMPYLFDLVSNGSDAYAVWYDPTDDAVRGRSMTAARTTLDVLSPNGFAKGLGVQYVTPRVAAYGTNLVVLIADGRDLWVAPLPAPGTVGQPIRSQPFPGDFVMAGGPQGVLLNSNDGAELMGWDGSFLEPFPPAQRAIDQGWIGLAFSGQDGLLAWTEASAWANTLGVPPNQVWAARVDSTGTVIDTMSLAITPVTRSVGKVKVVFDGGEYLVSWVELAPNTAYLRARVVSLDGTISELLTYGVGSEVFFSCIPATACLFAYSTVPIAGTSIESTASTVSTVQSFAFDPVGLAASDSSFLLVGLKGGQQLQGVRLDDQNRLLDSAPFDIADLSGCFYSSSFVVASDGTDFMVGYECTRQASGGSASLYLVQIDASGAVANFRVLANGVGPMALTWDGKQYIAAWARADHNLVAQTFDKTGAPTGAVSVTSECVGQLGRPKDIVLASNGSANVMLAYTRSVNSESGSERVRLRAAGRVGDAGNTSAICDGDLPPTPSDGGVDGDASTMPPSDGGIPTDGPGDGVVTAGDARDASDAVDAPSEAGSAADTGVGMDAAVDSIDGPPDSQIDAMDANDGSTSPTDAGSRDASSPEAGGDAGAPPASGGGCGCYVADDTGSRGLSGLSAILVLGLLFSRRRRARGRRQSSSS
jgi:MYXO-CTERM domain-containing protein